MRYFAILLVTLSACSVETGGFEPRDGGIAGLTCAPGQVAKWQADGWGCAADESGGDAYWEGTGNDIFFTTGKVGIGTDTPAQELDVVGNLYASGTICNADGCLGGAGEETDPQVGTIGADGQWCTTDGTTVNCDTPAPVTVEDDPEVGTIGTSGQWCTTDGTTVNCDSPAPVTTEVDPQVGTIGSSGQWCTTNGTTVNCTSPAPVTTESDPTVLASVKDGVTWGELSGIPAGFADGIDNTGAGTWTVAGSDIYYDTGNVGIGTAAPAVALDVVGDAQVSNDLDVGGQFSQTYHHAFTYGASVPNAGSQSYRFWIQRGCYFLVEVQLTGYRGFQTVNTNSKKWAANCAFYDAGIYQKNITTMYEMGEEAANLSLDVVPDPANYQNFDVIVGNTTGGTFYGVVHVTILTGCTLTEG